MGVGGLVSYTGGWLIYIQITSRGKRTLHQDSVWWESGTKGEHGGGCRRSMDWVGLGGMCVRAFGACAACNVLGTCRRAAEEQQLVGACGANFQSAGAEGESDLRMRRRESGTGPHRPSSVHLALPCPLCLDRHALPRLVSMPQRAQRAQRSPCCLDLFAALAQPDEAHLGVLGQGRTRRGGGVSVLEGRTRLPLPPEKARRRGRGPGECSSALRRGCATSPSLKGGSKKRGAASPRPPPCTPPVLKPPAGPPPAACTPRTCAALTDSNLGMRTPATLSCSAFTLMPACARRQAAQHVHTVSKQNVSYDAEVHVRAAACGPPRAPPSWCKDGSCMHGTPSPRARRQPGEAGARPGAMRAAARAHTLAPLTHHLDNR